VPTAATSALRGVRTACKCEGYYEDAHGVDSHVGSLQIADECDVKSCFIARAMTRALGVFVVLMAFTTTSIADETAEKSAPAEKAEAKQAKKPKKGAKKVAPPVEEPAAEEEDRPPTEEEIEAALAPHLKGPQLVELGSNVEIDLPAGVLLFERAEARKMLEQVGDDGENVLGIVQTVGSSWWILIEYDDVGYVSDKDANELDANELFRSFEQGNVAQNARRKTLNIPPLYLDGWSEMPTYKAQQHHLVWGLKGHSDEGPVINFFTRILGRNGYMSVNLIDSPNTIEQSKLDTTNILGAVRFKSGFRYEDHKEGDRDSGLGLSALVLGGAGVAAVKVAKTGFLIKLLLVFKKGFIVIIAAIAGFFKWIFGRKKDEDDLPPPDVSSEPSSPEV
jgi:uncharacterized membrane-anchored protein